jgi:hypothetical protein
LSLASNLTQNGKLTKHILFMETSTESKGDTAREKMYHEVEIAERIRRKRKKTQENEKGEGQKGKEKIRIKKTRRESKEQKI